MGKSVRIVMDKNAVFLYIPSYNAFFFDVNKIGFKMIPFDAPPIHQVVIVDQQQEIYNLSQGTFIDHPPYYVEVRSQQEKQLILYYRPNCPFCEKVLTSLKKQGWVEKNGYLAKKGTKQRIILKNVAKDRKAAQQVVSYGKNQVPCLLIDGKPLYESDDIIEYLKHIN